MRSLALCIGVGLFTISVLPAANPGKLRWSDEFSGKAGRKPDPAKWTYDLGGNGWGNQELENYTKKSKNVFLDGRGNLIIRAIKDSRGRFTSARIKTQGLFSFTYGRAEARMRIPRGQGMWPAFWMLGNDVAQVNWPACGEIDIMESLGREPTIVHGTIHGPGYSGGAGITAQYVLPGAPALADDFHLYAADWMPDRIDFSIDGHVYTSVTPKSLPARTKWIFDHPFFLILNLAVGGAWPGNPDATTVFPQDLVIDYVRVYELPANQ
jgi:beta-glucanase (GH16 family)